MGSLFDPVITISAFIQINHRDWSECAETCRKGSACSNLSSIVQKRPSTASWSRLRSAPRKFQKLERRFASLADNEQVLADDHNSAVHVSNHDQSRGVVLAVEEEYVLRCLGAALIMQWNTFPTTLQREVIDTGGSVGKLLETESLRGQIARFLHKHKNDYGCNKLTPTEDTHSAMRGWALRLCRGGTMREARSATDCRCE